MAIELPQHIRDLEIPRDLDARGGFSMLGNNFANAVDENDVRAAQARKLDTHLKEKNEHDLGVSGKAESAGVRVSGSAANLGVARDEREKADQKRRNDAMDLQQYLSMLNREIEGIDTRITEIDERLVEIETDLQELDRLDDLIKTSDIDPSNPNHAKLMDKYGVTEDDLNSPDAAIIVAQKKNELENERGALKAERGDLVVRRGDLAAKRDHANQVQSDFESGKLSDVEVSEKISEMATESFDTRGDLGTILGKTNDSKVTDSIIETLDSTEAGQNELRLASSGNDMFANEGEMFNFDAPPSRVTSAAREFDEFELNAPDVQGAFTRSANAETPTTAPSVEQNIDLEINTIAL